MKIRKIRYENHFLFGNTEFDFTDCEGNTVDTIIIAGENGVGKSRLMNDIHKLSKYYPSSIIRNEVIHYEIEISEDQVEILKQQARLNNMVINFGKIFRISLNLNIVDSWESISVRNISSNGKEIAIGSYDLDKNRHMFLSTFSNSEVNFNYEPIKSIRNSDIDMEKLSAISNSNLATDIAQLLVDIQTLDAHDLNDWVRKNTEKVPPDSVIDIRIKRFTNAFDYMFPTKRYERIENTENGKEVIFSENGNEMTLNQLSSGEKQIVFRGGFLLKNKESARGL